MREKCEGRLNSGFWWNSNDKTQMFADMEKIASFDGNGLLILNHANGQLKYELSYKNHKLDGISKAYYENGKVKSQVNYVDGIAQGHAEFLGEDGRLTETAEYADGFKVLSKIHIYGTEGCRLKGSAATESCIKNGVRTTPEKLSGRQIIRTKITSVLRI